MARTGAKYKNIGLIVNASKPLVPAAAARAAAILSACGAEVLLEKDNSAISGIKGKRLSLAWLAKQSDLLLSLGGDGTLLKAAALACEKGTAILGVNLGTLGFVTALAESEMESALPAALAGRFKMETRTMLEGRVIKGLKVVGRLVALNELLVAKGFAGRVAEFSTEVNGKHLATYRADGLIIATPTGSTAYALSAGGPILQPGTDTVLLAPVTPHSLSNRPLVLPQHSVIRVAANSRRDPVYVAADGRERRRLEIDEVLEVRKAKEVTNLLVPGDYDYFEVLRAKLGWRGK